MTEPDLKEIISVLNGLDPNFLKLQGDGVELERPTDCPDFILGILSLIPGKIIIENSRFKKVQIVLENKGISDEIATQFYVLLEFFSRTIPPSNKLFQYGKKVSEELQEAYNFISDIQAQKAHYDQLNEEPLQNKKEIDQITSENLFTKLIIQTQTGNQQLKLTRPATIIAILETVDLEHLNWQILKPIWGDSALSKSMNQNFHSNKVNAITVMKSLTAKSIFALTHEHKLLIGDSPNNMERCRFIADIMRAYDLIDDESFESNSEQIIYNYITR